MANATNNIIFSEIREFLENILKNKEKLELNSVNMFKIFIIYNT